MIRDDEPELSAGSFVLRVEGRRTVHVWDEAALVLADRLEEIARGLGLEVFRAPLSNDGEVTPRRWTNRRVTRADVLRVVSARPEVSFDDLLEALFREPPWTDARRAQAAGKLRVHLHRLRREGQVTKVVDAVGEERYSATSAAATATDETPTAAVLTDVKLEAGVAVLRRLKVFDEVDLAKDPDLYRDLARGVYVAMSGQRRRGQERGEQT